MNCFISVLILGLMGCGSLKDTGTQPSPRCAAFKNMDSPKYLDADLVQQDPQLATHLGIKSDTQKIIGYRIMSPGDNGFEGGKYESQVDIQKCPNFIKYGAIVCGNLELCKVEGFDYQNDEVSQFHAN